VIQPTDAATYDWTAIDDYLGLCETYGKSAGISVNMGVDSPDWVKSDGQVAVFTEHGPHAGDWPLIWNEKYQALVRTFIQTFGERYDNNEHLLYFLPGIGQTLETVVALDPTDVTDLTTLAAGAGFPTLVDAWLNSSQRIFGYCNTALKHTYSTFADLTRVVPNSTPGKNGYDGEQELVDTVQLAVFPLTCGIMNDFLNAVSSHILATDPLENKLIFAHKAEMSCGLRFGHESSDHRCDPSQDPGAYDATLAFTRTLTAAIDIGAHFVELFPDDATSADTDYIDAIIAANTDLAANVP
jgi:hypothetical protein